PGTRQAPTISSRCLVNLTTCQCGRTIWAMSQSVDVFLRAVRLAAGLSQEALAARAGVSRQAYLAIESGRAVPSTEVSLRLAPALGRSVEDLFRLSESPDEVQVEVVGGALRPDAPTRVRLARVNERLLAWPLVGARGVA